VLQHTGQGHRGEAAVIDLARDEGLFCYGVYRGTSLIRNSALLGPYSRTQHRALEGVAFFYERGTPVRDMTDRLPLKIDVHKVF